MTQLASAESKPKSKLVPPHGSATLKPLLLTGTEREQALQLASTLPAITLSSRERGDLIMLGIGGFTPLDGFMNQADWQGVVDTMHLQTGSNAGLFWPIPITLSAPKATADSLNQGDKVALVAENGEIMGVLTVEETYTIDKAHECQQVFTTTDPEHPGVQQVLSQDEVNIAGRVEVLSEGEFPHCIQIFIKPLPRRVRYWIIKVGKRWRHSRLAIQCIAHMNIWPKLLLRFVMGYLSIHC